MSLIDSIFGTTCIRPQTDVVVAVDTIGSSEAQLVTKSKLKNSTTDGSTNSKTKTIPNEAIDTDGDVDDSRRSDSVVNSLFQTVIPIPDRKLEYLTTKRGARTQTAAATDQNKRRKHDDGSHDDLDNNDDIIGPSQQHQPTKGTNQDKDVNERTIFVGNIPISYTRKHLRQLFVDCGTVESTRIRGVAIKIVADSDTNKKNSYKTKKETHETDEKDCKSIKLPPSLAGQQQVYKKVCVNTNYIDPSKKQSNIGYVVFLNKESVELALRKNNMIVPVQPSLLSNTGTNTPTSSPLSEDVRHLRVDRVAATTTTTTTTDTTDHHSPTRDPKRTIFIGNLPYHTDEETLHQHIIQHMKVIEDDTTTTTTTATTNKVIESIRIVRHPTTYVCQGFAYVLFTSIQYVPTALRTLHQTIYMKQPLRIQICKNKTKTTDQQSKKGISHNNNQRDHTLAGISKSTSDNGYPKTSSPRTTTTTGTGTTITKAVGALKRVLQKQQRLLQQDTKSKLKTVRKRGPTTSSKPTRTNKSTNTPKKKKK